MVVKAKVVFLLTTVKKDSAIHNVSGVQKASDIHTRDVEVPSDIVVPNAFERRAVSSNVDDLVADKVA